MNRDVTQHFQNQATLRPFVCSRMFEAQSDLTFDVLLGQLRNQGAQLLCWDQKAGVVSWCDTSGYLVPLPVAADEVSMPGFDYVKVTTWKGYVYGCARTLATDGGSWLAVYARGRDTGRARRIYSDGTYEWRLLRAVERTIHQIATGQRQAPESPSWKQSTARTAPKTYADLFNGHFARLPKINADDIAAKSPGMQYPVSVDRMWGACLDVITQYDLVPYINSDDRVILFSRNVSIPRDVNSVNLMPVDVLMAVSIEEQEEEESCMFHAAFLGDQDLLPRSLVRQSVDPSGSVATELTGTPLEIAAAVVAGELERHIDIQLLYNENWGNKLLRHMRE